MKIHILSLRSTLSIERLEHRQLLTNFPTFVADLDGDTDLDIVSQSGLYTNVDRQGTFVKHEFNGTSSMATGDFDQDGDIDFATNKPSWFENTGNGFEEHDFTIPYLFQTPRVETVDYGNDGDEDLVFYSDQGNSIRVEVAENKDGDFQFIEAFLIPGERGFQRFSDIGDLDDDGDLDFLHVRSSGDHNEHFEAYSIDLKTNSESILYEHTATLDQRNLLTRSTYPIRVFTEDVNGDGRNDLLTEWYRGDSSGLEEMEIRWQAKTDNGFALSQRVMFSGNYNMLIDMIDIDFDGTNDVLYGGVDVGTTGWLQNTGNDFIEGNAIAAFATAAGDLNEDGTIDYVSCVSEDQTCHWIDGSDGSIHLPIQAGTALARIDLLQAEIRDQVASLRDPSLDYDLNGIVDTTDVEYLITSVIGTTFGDSNLDLTFDSGDLVAVFAAGQYEDGIPENSTWATGDWNGDAEFDTGDLVFAFQRGSYVKSANHSQLAAALDSNVVDDYFANEDKSFNKRIRR